jgi:transposase
MLSATTEQKPKRRRRRDPNPRFLPDQRAQIDALLGCPELQLPADHLARKVRDVVELIDTTPLRAHYSSLGRHGHDPARLLAMWLYASMIGVHYATGIARLTTTDAAFRWLAGGHTPSLATLKRFRQRNGEFFLAAIERTVELAHERGLLKTDELAVDSMRLRANASMTSLRRKSRSTKRLEQLARVDGGSLSANEQAKHARLVERHQKAVETCERKGVASYSETNELAALMKFPHGSAMLGHRITATAAGASHRFVVGVFIDASPNDTGKLPEAIPQVLATLESIGIPKAQRIRLLADAGYWDAESLRYAESVSDRAEILIDDAQARPQRHREKFFARERFTVSTDERSVTCPAGRLMKGPESARRGVRRWFGVGCEGCSLQPQCTPGKRRRFVVRDGFEGPRDEMRKRLKAPESQAHYRKRSAIIEPVFASLQSEMGYRRASSRLAQTVTAEVLLKLLAHNIRRLLAATPLSVLWLPLHATSEPVV